MDVVTAFAFGIVSKIGELLVVPITRRIGFVIEYDRNINSLKDRHKDLEGRKYEVQSMVDADRRNGREIAPYVEDWLRKADNIETELQKFYQDEATRRENFFYRYSFGKAAKMKCANVESLKEEKFDIISYPAAPLKLGSTFTEGIKSFGSRISIMSEIIEKLKDDEFKRIGICGMGVVGKTTLVKEMIKVMEADKLFDEISMAVVSQNLDYRRIQGQIADMLGLRLDKETEHGRASQLLDRLNKTKRVLIVLDDVWTELDFESIGLPSTQHHNSLKILFTSRNEDVCYKMRSQKNFIVSTLSRGEAWGLFQEIVGGDLVDRPNIHLIAKEVAMECGGLPLAIVTIGKALGNAERHVWEDALDQLRKSSITSLSEMQDCVYSRIEISYNFLGSEEIKSCLLLCCLFPEDFEIPIEVLVRHGVGLGFLKGVDVLWKARNRVHTMVDKLRKRFLLLDSYKEECFKMHDVVRDAIISIAHRKKYQILMQSDVKLGCSKGFTRNHPIEISMLLNDIEEHSKGKECPNLKLLEVVSKERESIPEDFFKGMSKLREREPIPEDFFKGMSLLKVFSLQNLCILASSSLFLALYNLRALRLENCQVGDVSIIGKELRNLEILSFARSDLKQLPVEIGGLSFLKLLDLTDCNALCEVSSNVLASLSQLEELYFRVMDFCWEQNDAILVELKSLLRQLKVFEVILLGVETLPKDLVLRDLVRFWVYVGEKPKQFFHFVRHGYLHPSILKLNNVDYSYIRGSVTIQELLKKSEFLKLKDVKHVKNVIYELDRDGFQFVETLWVESCDDLEYLIDASDDTSCNAFPLVQSLSLFFLDNLKEIYHVSNNASQMVSSSLCQCFGSLTDLRVKYCETLKSIFSQFPVISLAKLQHLDVYACDGIECIISNKLEEVEKSKVELQNLKELCLEALPSLVSFSKAIIVDEPSQLMSQLASDEGLRSVKHHPLINGFLFPNLIYLSIKGCNKIWSLFFPNSAKSLASLQLLCISDCESIEEIVSREESASFSKIVFFRLQELELEGLSNLKAFCQGPYDFDFPSLKTVSIKDCHKMDLFSNGFSDAPKLEKATMWIGLHSSKNTRMQDLNSISQLYRKTVDLQNSETVRWTEQDCNVLCHIIRGREMILHDFKRLLRVVPLNEINVFQGIKQLAIKKCDSLVEVFESVGVDVIRMENNMAHYELEEMTLEWLPKLVHIWRNLVHVVSFKKLKIVKVEHCHSLRSILAPSMAKSLVLLQCLEVCYCEMIEEIVSKEEDENGGVNNTMKILFPELNKLKLSDLPHLKCFCSGTNFYFELPSCQEMIITDCPNMLTFSNGVGTVSTPKLPHLCIESNEYIEMMGDLNTTLYHAHAPPLNFKVQLQSSETIGWMEQDQQLLDYITGVRQLVIEGSQKFVNCIPSNMIHRFQHLKELRVGECSSLIEIFESKGIINHANNDEGDALMLYELQEIHLDSLPKLTHIWRNHGGVLGFQNLKTLQVECCHSLKSVLSPSIVKSLFQLEKLAVYECEMVEDIVTKEDKENVAKIVIPKLQELHLADLPNVKCFYPGDDNIEMPSCNEMNIIECFKMHTFCYGSVSTPSLYYLYVDEIILRPKEDLNTIILHQNQTME